VAGGHGETLGMIAGHVAAGAVVLTIVLRSYLAPCAQADADDAR
jgi:hypothetical protein